MNKPNLIRLVAGGGILLASGLSQAVITGDLLTGNTVTTAWQDCAGSDLVDTGDNEFDPGHLAGSGCANVKQIL